MLDKLEMRSKESVDLKKIKEVFSEFQITHVPDNQYQTCIVCRHNGIEIITLKTNPTPFFRNVHPLKIIVNPCKWSTLSALTSKLSQICSIEALEISRIDHAVDIAITLDSVFKSLRIKQKSKSESYSQKESNDKGILTGFTIGRKPELYCIYDKNYRLIKGNLTKQKKISTNTLTRIELRQFNKKVNYKTLSELHLYIEHPPFKSLEFIKFEESDSPKLLKLQLFIELYGFDGSYHRLNESNNFKRTYKDMMVANDFKNILEETYKSELRTWLEVN